MAIFGQIPKEEIARDYTHYGLMFGFVPIYYDEASGQNRVAVRNWWPEWLLDFGQAIYFPVSFTMTLMDREYEPMFFIQLRGKINGDSSNG